MKPSRSTIFKSDSLAKPQGEECEDRSKQACEQQLAMEPSQSTISKADSLGLAKPQGEGCEDQSTYTFFCRLRNELDRKYAPSRIWRHSLHACVVHVYM